MTPNLALGIALTLLGSGILSLGALAVYTIRTHLKGKK